MSEIINVVGKSSPSPPDWGFLLYYFMGNGDWALGIGDWGLGIVKK
jgi:hypothetical protein